MQCACGDGIAGDVILIRLVEKMATCILIFVAVILLRVLIRAIAMRCYPSLGTSFLQCPEFEGPCLLSQFWALTDSLAKGVGDGCTVSLSCCRQYCFCVDHALRWDGWPDI